jgi:ankyrin repeat protein
MGNVNKLMNAASIGDLSTVMKWIEKKKVNVNAQNGNGLTALMVAVYYNHLPVMMYLMKMGCDVNITDKVSLSDQCVSFQDIIN